MGFKASEDCRDFNLWLKISSIKILEPQAHLPIQLPYAVEHARQMDQ